MLKLRRMCGGGYAGSGWREVRTTDDPSGSKAHIHDRSGFALVVRDPHNSWPLQPLSTWTRHVAYRAGYPDRQNPAHPVRRVGRGWIRVGPWVFGRLNEWDGSGAP